MTASALRSTRTADAASTGPSWHLDVSVLTDVGCLREVNEDCGRYIHPGAPALVAQHGVLAIVADGMGGHAAGDVASRMAVDDIARHYYAQADTDPHAALAEAIRRANRAIYEASVQNLALDGMGTTCTALVLRAGMAYGAHVGDSRCYLLRDGHLQSLTTDHSLVMEMVQQGLLHPSEARTHEDRNVITRALGLYAEVDVDTWSAPLAIQEGDVFLLSTDGLHDLLDEADLQALLTDTPAPRAAHRLVQRARQAGGPDNITALVVRVQPPEAAPPTRATRTAVA